MLGNLTPFEIEQVLENQLLGRVGCHADGKTYVVPITFAYDGEYIYGHSREGLKIHLMRQNPKVCFEVDEMKDLANWSSVVVQGEYEELLGEPAREAMAFFMKKMQPHLVSQTSVPTHGLKDFHRNEQSSIKSIIFRIKALEKTGRFERTTR